MWLAGFQVWKASWFRLRQGQMTVIKALDLRPEAKDNNLP
jgi:hypothetical protein